MRRKVLGISTSPRVKGNTDLLVREALRGAESVDAEADYLSLIGRQISPCVECNQCYETGVCRVQDDFQDIFTRMLEADALVFGAPVFFMTVPAQAKMLIDRCQCLWSRKYVLKEPLWETGGRDRRGLVLSVGGSTSRRMFRSVRLTFTYYFDVLDVAYYANLFVNRVDERGAIREHGSAMEEARRLGADLADFRGEPPEKPHEVWLSGADGFRPAEVASDSAED